MAGSPVLCFDVYFDPGLEIHGEVVLENGDLFNQADDQRLIKLCDGGGLAFDGGLILPLVQNLRTAYICSRKMCQVLLTIS